MSFQIFFERNNDNIYSGIQTAQAAWPSLFIIYRMFKMLDNVVNMN